MSNYHSSQKKDRDDEFYTTLEMIENELKFYKNHFKGKVVLCNCDDPYESNFFKYFAINFNYLGLKKLITTCYVSSPVVYTQLSLFPDMEFSFNKNSSRKKPYKVEITEVSDENGDGAFDLEDIRQLLKNKKNVCSVLNGDGDFRSEECVELLKEADIVVTNPPFSLFRDFIDLLMKNNKKFLFIGRGTAITYKETLPLFMSNQLWLGRNSGHFWFRVPDYYKEKATDFKIDEQGQKWRRMGNISWFTNLDYPERYDDTPFWKHYTPEEYPKYDNYDAIEVSETKNIPCDYYGVMGVPTTFLNKWNPNEFEILGSTRYHDNSWVANDINYINGKCKFTRILIRRKGRPHED